MRTSQEIEGAVLLEGLPMWLALGGSLIALLAVLLVHRRSTRINHRRNDVVAWGDKPDSWEGYFTNVPEAVPLRGLFTFAYEDTEGSYSHRKVEALIIIPRSNRVTLFGRCLSRNEYRHFDLTRVVQMVDVESGKSIENPGLDLVLRSRAND